MKTKKKIKEVLQEGEVRFKHIKVEFKNSTTEAKGSNIMPEMPLLILETFKKHIEECIDEIKRKEKQIG